MIFEQPNKRKFSTSSSSSSSPSQKRTPKKPIPSLSSNGIVTLRMDEAYTKIAQKSRKEDSRGSDLRWIRNTKNNRAILINYLVKRILVDFVVNGSRKFYSSTFNVFYLKREEWGDFAEEEHNSLDMLLTDTEKEAMFDFKKTLLKKLNTKKLNRKDAKAEAQKFITKEFRLKRINHFLQCLSRKDGCFQLPLIKENLSKSFQVHHHSLVKTEEPLKFKVDLTEENEVEEVKPSPGEQAGREAWERSRAAESKQQNKLKKLKTAFLTGKNTQKANSELMSDLGSQDVPPPIFVDSKTASPLSKDYDDQMEELGTLVDDIDLEKSPRGQMSEKTISLYGPTVNGSLENSFAGELDAQSQESGGLQNKEGKAKLTDLLVLKHDVQKEVDKKMKLIAEIDKKVSAMVKKEYQRIRSRSRSKSPGGGRRD